VDFSPLEIRDEAQPAKKSNNRKQEMKIILSLSQHHPSFVLKSSGLLLLHKYTQMPRNNKKRYYAVARGRSTGIFTTWEACQAQVNGFVGNKFKGFATQQEALQFLRMHNVQYQIPSTTREDFNSQKGSVSNKRPCLIDRPTSSTSTAASASTAAHSVIAIDEDNDYDDNNGTSSSLSALHPSAHSTSSSVSTAVAISSSTTTAAAACSTATTTFSEADKEEGEVETLAVKTLDETLQEKLQEAQASGQLIEIMSPDRSANQPLPKSTTTATSNKHTPNTSLRQAKLEFKNDHNKHADFATQNSMESSVDSDDHDNNKIMEILSSTNSEAAAALQLVPKTNDRRVRITEVLNINLTLKIKEADERDQKAFPHVTRRMQGDVPSLVLHNKFFCQGVRVGWPYPAILPPQRQMVNHVIMGLKRSLHVVLESPTGTGKSAALLCSTLAWQRHYDKCHDGTPPKIYYCSRTHSQGMCFCVSFQQGYSLSDAPKCKT
jgi:hypothetical protein